MRDLKVHDNVELKNYLRMELDVRSSPVSSYYIINSTFVYDLSIPMTSVSVVSTHWDWLAISVDP